MKLLSYDTSSEVLSASIHDGQKLVAELNDASLGRHSDRLIPSLDCLLKESRMRLEDMDYLAVGLGPGSFTGLRVGVTTAKLLAYASGMKIVGVPSLEAIACGVLNWEGPIAVLLDARKGKVYAALYEKSDKMLKIIFAPKLVMIEDLMSKINKQAYFIGDAVPIYRGKLAKQLKRRFYWEAASLLSRHVGRGRGWPRSLQAAATSFPKAKEMAKAAFHMIGQQKFIDPFKLEPLYLYPKDCNVMVRPTYGAKRRQVGHAPSSQGGAAQRQRGILVSTYGTKS